MKHAFRSLGAIALLATAIVAQADQFIFQQFDVSNDPACWVAPEWRD